jgi:hypothetical protein
MLFPTIFIVTFLSINHLCSTTASPMDYKGSVTADRPANLTHSLAKRRYIPPDSLCLVQDHWLSRRCIPRINDRRWLDSCFRLVNGVTTIFGALGSCPVGTMCQNVLVASNDAEFPDPDDTIRCINRPTVNINTGGQGQQTGVVRVVGVPGASEEHIISVPLPHPISGASVSAYLEDTKGPYVVAAVSAAIVGSLRGTDAKPCDYNQTNQVCAPTGIYNFKTGNIVDFTFGILDTQVFLFYYAILGSA